MPPRRTRKDSQLSDDGFKSQQSSEQKVRITKRKELFIQQFEKEAQNQINEMEANLNKLLATVDRVFKIELMKMPQSLHTTLIKDLMKEGDTSVGEVTMALTLASPEIQKPLSRKPSKKGLNGSAGRQRPSSQSKISTIEAQKKSTKKSHQNSKSTGLKCHSTVSSKRTQGRVLHLSDQGIASTPKFRHPFRSLGDEMIAAATIVTSHGETLVLCEENKDEINIELLDDVALNQMRKIKDLMDYLCNKVEVNATQ